MLAAGLPVQSDEVLAVFGQHGTPTADRIGEDRYIWYRLASNASLLHGDHVVAETAEFLYGPQRETFIGVQVRHRLLGFVLSYLIVDLLLVSAYIGPGVDQILGAESGKIAKDVGAKVD